MSYKPAAGCFELGAIVALKKSDLYSYIWAPDGGVPQAGGRNAQYTPSGMKASFHLPRGSGRFVRLRQPAIRPVDMGIHNLK